MKIIIKRSPIHYSIINQILMPTIQQCQRHQNFTQVSDSPWNLSLWLDEAFSQMLKASFKHKYDLAHVCFYSCDCESLYQLQNKMWHQTYMNWELKEAALKALWHTLAGSLLVFVIDQLAQVRHMQFDFELCDCFGLCGNLWPRSVFTSIHSCLCFVFLVCTSTRLV